MATSGEPPTDAGSAPLSLAEVAETLGVHYMTVYRYVRTGRLPARRAASGDWQVEAADLSALRRGPAGPARGRPKVDPRSNLEARMLAGDEAGAWALVESALGSGTTPQELLLDVLAPTMSAIGERWLQGTLSIADEHRSSAVATRLVSRLGARFNPRGLKKGTVVLAAPAGELHALPVAIAANLLRWQGFEVVELGADTPAEAVAGAVAAEMAPGRSGVFAVALACTTTSALPAAALTLSLLRELSPRPPLLLGGAGVGTRAEALELGADVYSGKRADELVSALEALVPARRNGRKTRA